MSRYFEHAASSDEANDKVVTMTENILAQIIQERQESFLTAEEKSLATLKLQRIDIQVGYPKVCGRIAVPLEGEANVLQSPDAKNPNAIQAYYSGLNITTSFYNNIVSAAMFNVNKSFERLSHSTDKAEWWYASDESYPDAFYTGARNDLVILGGILQHPVFSVDLPDYINYGSIGSVCGHELSHSLDSVNRLYNPSGVYANWWSNGTIATYEDRSQCFIQEYSNFTLETPDGPIPVDGNRTLAENLADNGGVHAAYNAWRRNEDNKPADQRDKLLQGLNFTADQLFFLSAGNFFCEKIGPVAAQVYATNEHPPGFTRIKGIMLNQPSFRKAFSCPNQNITCNMWSNATTLVAEQGNPSNPSAQGGAATKSDIPKFCLMILAALVVVPTILSEF
jgi:endothelin-converting enzyme